ncbi:MAG TPA: efflux RND transporter periplasmic adaptor subunit [Rhodocyclaceae bacterium]|nr:efflux RND transporter periplasmic adaptor subunit [Rhodocyclaceae bacterium]
MTAARKAVILVLVLALGAFALFRTHLLDSWEAKRQEPSLLLSGNIEAHESVLSFKTVQSRIVSLPFNEGQWVKRGMPVAAVDDSDTRQQFEIAQAQLAVQERQLDSARQSLRAAGSAVAADEAELAQRRQDRGRSAELRSRGFLSAAALEQAGTAVDLAQAVLERDRALASVAARNIGTAQAGVRAGEAAVALARIVRGYATLYAPFDGVITVRQAEIGEVVVPGTPVLSIADLDHVWLRAYVNETDLGRLPLGSEAVVTTDSYPGKRYRGRVSFIASQAEFTPKSVETHAERVTLVYRIKIDIDNAGHELVPGMPADARIALRAAR